MFVVALDIGNSSTKISVNGRLTRVAANLDTKDQQALLGQAIEPVAFGDLFWSVCSVNRKSTSRLRDWVAAERPADRFHEIHADDIPLPSNVENRNGVGRDRLLGSWWASKNSDGRNVVVVDAGTAVTIDVVNEKTFIGGLIFPGADTCLKALSDKTDALPDLTALPSPIDDSWIPESIQIGRSTNEAILLGVHQHQFAGILSVVSSLQRCYDADVVCTGGALLPMVQWLPENWQFDESLLLDAANAIANLIIEGSSE
jgi:pantothenate kinase type III